MISIVTNNKIETKRVTGKNFRLVHDTKNVITVVEGTKKSTTHTIHEVGEFETEQEVQDFIEKEDIVQVGDKYEVFKKSEFDLDCHW